MDFAIDQEMLDDGGPVLETVAERYTDDARFPEKAPEIVRELRAFRRFVQREYEPSTTPARQAP